MRRRCARALLADRGRSPRPVGAMGAEECRRARAQPLGRVVGSTAHRQELISCGGLVCRPRREGGCGTLGVDDRVDHGAEPSVLAVSIDGRRIRRLRTPC